MGAPQYMRAGDVWRAGRRIWRAAHRPFLYFLFSSAIVWLGVAFGRDFVPLCHMHPSAKRVDSFADMAAWDGEWYVRIAREGYFFDRTRHSSVAFYPAYPVIGGLIARAAGVRIDQTLVILSHVYLLAAFFVVRAYVRERFSSAQGLDEAVLLALSLYPVTLYFRMAYTESLFVLVSVVALYAMDRRWPLAAVALIIGFATATRSVGIALAAPFAIHLWRVSPRRLDFAKRCMFLMPLCGWGLAAYMAYQAFAFGEPLAFVQTQVHWNHRQPAAGLGDLFARLATAEPLRAVYDPESRGYWARWPPGDMAVFNLFFANPVYFLLACGLIGVGGVARWLNAKEVALGAALLLIPYITHADRACMAGEARYSSAIFPVYIVLGHLLWRLPSPIAVATSLLSASLLGLYTALFVSWYWFY